MSRHRNVRSMNYSDEYDGYDDVYGHSVEDDYTISPSDAAFMYDRNRQSQMSAYLHEGDDIAEVDETGLDEPGSVLRRSDSASYRRPELGEVDEARLRSCLDEIRNVIGDAVAEHVLIDTVIRNEFDVVRALDQVLSAAASSKQADDVNVKRQREKKDTGKDQDDDATPVISEKEFKSVQKGIADLAIQPPTPVGASPLDKLETPRRGSHLQESISKLKLNSSKMLGRPKFQHKGVVSHSSWKENLSDDEENGASLSSLIAQHTKKALTPANTFASLADRANQHLKSNPLLQKNPHDCTGILKNAIIPPPSHLGTSGTNSGDDKIPNKFLIPKLGLFKQVPDNNTLAIDLSCALKPAMNRRRTDRVRIVENASQMETDFLDDSVLERLSVLHRVEEFNCAANSRNILNAKVPVEKALSAFGKVVCRKWVRRAGLLYMPASRESWKEITPFDFKSPSPDDIIKKHLRKK